MEIRFTRMKIEFVSAGQVEIESVSRKENKIVERKASMSCRNTYLG